MLDSVPYMSFGNWHSFLRCISYPFPCMSVIHTVHTVHFFLPSYVFIQFQSVAENYKISIANTAKKMPPCRRHSKSKTNQTTILTTFKPDELTTFAFLLVFVFKVSGLTISGSDELTYPGESKWFKFERQSDVNVSW